MHHLLLLPSAPQDYSRIERRKPRPGTAGEHRADAVDLIRRRLPETSRLEVDSVEPDMDNAAKPVCGVTTEEHML